MILPGQTLVISPHLDDAVLSVGALISAAPRGDTHVLTIFTGEPEGEPTPAAIEDRARFDGADPLPIRLAEDDAATAALGFTTTRAGIPELIYRRRSDGRARCESLEDIYDPPDADDELVTEEVAAVIKNAIEEFNPATTLIPIGIGNHVDHVIVRRAAESLGSPFTYYREMPYLIRATPPPDPPGMIRVPWSVRGADIDAWLSAIGCYESQVGIMFEDDSWKSAFRAYAKSAGAYLLQRRLYPVMR